jgi:hypothetical protein
VGFGAGVFLIFWSEPGKQFRTAWLGLYAPTPQQQKQKTTQLSEVSENLGELGTQLFLLLRCFRCNLSLP